MKKTLLLSLVLGWVGLTQAQDRYDKRELSLNGFRNPSIGLEYGYKHLSVHAGYYITAFKAGVTTKFVKTGLTYWFLPIGKKEVPSSFYAGASYMRGLNEEYKDVNAIGMEVGFRWVVWKGLNLRMGIIAVVAKGKDVKFNPTPGISYTFAF